MNIKQRYKFVANVWFVGLYKGGAVLGRTYIFKSQNYAVIITENCEGLRVGFNDLTNIKKLTTLNALPPITSVVQNKKRLTVIENLLLETLMSINK